MLNPICLKVKMYYRNSSKLIILLWVILLAGPVVFAQTTGKYDPHEAFAPDFYPNEGNAYRTVTGRPGVAYWQNTADYKIDVSLDTVKHYIDGTVEITYHNNSPEALPYLWIQLEQQAFKKNSLNEWALKNQNSRYYSSDRTQGYQLREVSEAVNGRFQALPYFVKGTHAQLRLSQPLLPGKSIRIKIAYGFTVPLNGADRTGRLLTRHGWIYQIAQWYPRTVVFDDVIGWNNIPYQGPAEFYLDYGNYSYNITLPAGMLVAASGTLLHPEKVLTREELGRLEKARKSNETIIICDSTRSGSSFKKGNVTWQFSCHNSRDVAWAASSAFIWDAAAIHLPGGKTSLAQSFYPVESAGEKKWGASTQFMKACIEFYSQQLYPYNYPVVSNVAGRVEGMEYPGIVFCGWQSADRGLWMVTNHELGHGWFPMIVGSNETRYGWMDEGFNTFINELATKHCLNGQYYTNQQAQQLAATYFSTGTEAIMTRPDVLQARNSNIAMYQKPALGLKLLREQILGEHLFDYAFRTYIQTWAFKHPTPADFFRTMENAAGEDLGWFWRAWFLHNDKLDQAVATVRYTENNPAEGALITITNNEKMVMPLVILIKEEGKKEDTLRFPAEIWQKGESYTFHYPSSKWLQKVVIDPDGAFPDINIENNNWSADKGKLIPDSITTAYVFEHFLTAVGGREKLKMLYHEQMEAVGDVQGTQALLSFNYHKPGNYRQEITIPAVNMLANGIFISGDTVSQVKLGRDMTLSSREKTALKENLMVFPELHFTDHHVQATLQRMTVMVNNQEAYQINIAQPSGGVMKNYYDVSTFLKLRSISIADPAKPEEDVTIRDYDNYQIVKAVRVPFTFTINASGTILGFKVKTINLVFEE